LAYSFPLFSPTHSQKGGYSLEEAKKEGAQERSVLVKPKKRGRGSRKRTETEDVKRWRLAQKYQVVA